jgi:hypothetical protein
LRTRGDIRLRRFLWPLGLVDALVADLADFLAEWAVVEGFLGLDRGAEEDEELEASVAA